MSDLWLAIAHHILVFGLVIMLAAESALVRQGLGAAELKRLAGLDIGYGITAASIIVVGIHRVIFGAKGYVFYVENVWFWAKMATFALIGILSTQLVINQFINHFNSDTHGYLYTGTAAIHRR